MSPRPAGYSGTPLAKKLGSRENARALVLNEPDGYRGRLAPVPAGVEFTSVSDPPHGFVHLSVTSAAGLGARLKALRTELAPDGFCGCRGRRRRPARRRT